MNFFVKIGLICMFAMRQLHNRIVNSIQNLRNYTIKRSFPQFTSYCYSTLCGCRKPRGLRPFLSIVILFLLMRQPVEKNCNLRNNSTHTATPNSAKTVSLQKFNIEKNAKNRAYAFILDHKLLDEFKTFCISTKDVKDLHLLCLLFQQRKNEPINKNYRTKRKSSRISKRITQIFRGN